MQRRFLEKKRKLLWSVLLLLLVASLPLLGWVHAQRAMFLGEMRTLIEEQLSRSLGLKVSMSGFQVKLFEGIVLKRLSLRHPHHPLFLTFREVKIRGNRENAVVTFERGEAFWRGMKIHPRIHRVKLSLERENPLVFRGAFSVRDVAWGERRISSTGEMTFLVSDRNRPWQEVKMKMHTHRFLLEDRPLENLSGYFSVAKEKLFVERLRWGKLLSLSGHTSFTSPYPTEARLRFLHFDEEMLRHFFRDPEDKRIPRFVEGQIFLNGPLRAIHLRGHLVAHEGVLKEAPYQRMVNTFQGSWPVVRVESRIEREFPKESYAAVEGIVDLRALGQKGFYKTVALEGADAVVWKGVTLQHPSASEEVLVFGKNTSTTSVSLKTFLENGQAGEEPSEEFELEYRLKKEKSLKMRLKGEEEFVGLEHKLNF